MRDIANACGIALGATYYYFGSKEAIVLAYYKVAKDQLKPLLEDAVENARGPAGGLRSLLQVRFEYFSPNRKFLGAPFPHAAGPRDPHLPSAMKAGTCTKPIGSVCGSCSNRRGRPCPKTWPYLPSLLGLYQMALLLFWPLRRMIIELLETPAG